MNAVLKSAAALAFEPGPRDDAEARQVAGIIGGLTYKPRALESVEIALDELTIDWYQVEPGFHCIGKTIGELRVRQRTGASIIAVIEGNHKKKVNPGPDQALAAGAMVVLAGERHQVRACKALLADGSA